MADELGRAWNSLGRVHRGDLLQQPFAKKKKLDEMNPDKGGSLGLAVARVTNIDYEEHYVSLRMVIGTEQHFDKVPVPLTYPGAGCRHFLGAMPEVGDYCVVGWLPQESSEKWGGSGTPVILSWIVPGVWPGREWLVLSNFEEDEHDGGTSRDKEELRGSYDRIRHKLRHMQPGDIVASSSKGADLVLDEDVLLANRRGNEFLLRDADQAAVLRALQQFTALAGTRTYSGMVQRDATRLPTTMFSDGFVWDGPVQAYGDEGVHELDLPADGVSPKGALTPASALARRLGADGKFTEGPYKYDRHLDPYTFLRRGGYIDEDGFAVNPQTNDAVYGGKNIYRVGPGSTSNTTLLPGSRALTEHRIELTHTSDGVLPVSEQTDGFDAERLPPSDPDTPGSSPNRPYIEWVLGSVVGNDPYSAQGRKEYGVPLVAEVFDSTGGLSPRIVPARIVPEGQSGGTPLKEHAATLFRMFPVSGDLAPTWWSVTKQGQVRANISGPPTGYGLDLAVAGGMRMAVGGGLELLLKGGIHFGTLSKNSLRLRSEQGPVVIYGGGGAKDTEANQERQYGTGGGESGSVPSVEVHGRTNVRVRAEKKLHLEAEQIQHQARGMRTSVLEYLQVSAGKQITMTTEDMKVSTTGKRTETFSGPKLLLPTNGALHERTYTPMYPGLTAEEVTYQMGNREETFFLGNHTTTIIVGDLTYQTFLGAWTARAGLNQMTIDAAGISGEAYTGNVKLAAVAGAAIMKGSMAALIESAGPVQLKSGSFVQLQAPGNFPDVGFILASGSREPFTNLPFATWGLGAKGSIIS